MQQGVWLVFLCGLMVAATAKAETQVFQTSGKWEAFGGTDVKGVPICGVAAHGSGEKFFLMKHYKGTGVLTIQLSAKEWRIKNDREQDVELSFDKESPWTATGTGFHFNNGNAALEFDISASKIDEFLRDFADSNQMAVRFPDSDVSDWTADLDGTDVIITSMQRCIEAMY